MTSNLPTVLLLFMAIQGTQSKMTMQQVYLQQQIVFDISHQTLLDDGCFGLNSTYLKQFQGEIPTQYDGVICGVFDRPVVSLPVRIDHPSCPTPINVFFKIDPMALFTTLQTVVIDRLYANCPVQKPYYYSYPLILEGHKIDVQESKIYSRTLNILGADFLAKKNALLEMDYKEGKLKLSLFDKNMEEIDEL